MIFYAIVYLSVWLEQKDKLDSKLNSNEQIKLHWVINFY